MQILNGNCSWILLRLIHILWVYFNATHRVVQTHITLLKISYSGCWTYCNEKSRILDGKKMWKPSILSKVSASELIKHCSKTWRILQRSESSKRKKIYYDDPFLMFTTIKKYWISSARLDLRQLGDTRHHLPDWLHCACILNWRNVSFSRVMRGLLSKSAKYYTAWALDWCF